MKPWREYTTEEEFLTAASEYLGKELSRIESIRGKFSPGQELADVANHILNRVAPGLSVFAINRVGDNIHFGFEFPKEIAEHLGMERGQSEEMRKRVLKEMGIEE